MGKRAQRIPSWPGVIHSNKGRIHLRRPTCDILTIRLRRSGGPYIPGSRQSSLNSESSPKTAQITQLAKRARNALGGRSTFTVHYLLLPTSDAEEGSLP